MNGWTVFAALFTGIEQPLIAAVDTMIASLTGPIGRLLRATIAVLIAWRMLKASLKPSGNALAEFEGQLILGGAVFLLASQVATYHQYVADLFLRTMSTEVSQLITGAVGGRPITGAVFDDIWNTAFVAGLAVYKQLSWNDFGLQFLVVFYWLFALLASVAAFGIWLMSFIVLSLLIGTGPAFVAMYVVPATRAISQRWIGAIIGAIILQVFTVALLSILTQVEVAMIGQIASNGSGNAMAQLQLLLGGIALFVLSAAVLWQLPGAAAGLAGGLSFHTLDVSGAMRSGSSTAGAVVSGAASGVAAGGRAVLGAVQGGANAIRALPGRSLSSS